MEQKLTEEVEVLLKEKNDIKVTLKRTLDTTLLKRISSKGLLEKAEYSLPMRDTIGQSYYNISKGKLENSLS